MPTRVLIACDHIDYDGALHGGGRQFIELARALESHGDVEATFCVLRAPSGLGRELLSEGLPFHFFEDRPWNPASVLRFLRLIRERRIDVLHLTDYGASTLGRIAGLLTRTPAIVQVIAHHSEHQRRGFPWHVELAYRALAPATARALAISESVRDFAAEHMGFGRDVLEVLPYPLPQHSVSKPSEAIMAAVRAEYGIGVQDPVVGAVTRFFPSKGITYLLTAFAEVLRAQPNAWLMLLGQGPEEASLREQSSALGIQDRVIFAGYQRDIAHHEGIFRVAVMPSLEEGFGLSAVEALAMGIPVVASAVGGLPDVVRDGETGFLVPPADPDALTHAIVRLLEDEALHQSLSAAARVDVQRFSLDGYVSRLVQLYHELRRRRNAPRSMRLERSGDRLFEQRASPVRVRKH